MYDLMEAIAKAKLDKNFQDFKKRVSKVTEDRRKEIAVLRM